MPRAPASAAAAARDAASDDQPLPTEAGPPTACGTPTGPRRPPPPPPPRPAARRRHPHRGRLRRRPRRGPPRARGRRPSTRGRPARYRAANPSGACACRPRARRRRAGPGVRSHPRRRTAPCRPRGGRRARIRIGRASTDRTHHEESRVTERTLVLVKPDGVQRLLTGRSSRGTRSADCGSWGSS